MPQLSNGTQLFATGERDSRGRAIYRGADGGLYTFDGSSGQWIKGRAGNLSPSLTATINALLARGDREAAQLIFETQEQLSASIPPSQAYEVPSVNDFLSGARKDAAEYFEPDRKLIFERLDYAEQVAKQLKETTLQRNTEDKQRFTRVEDTAFARAINKAQGAFAGRGTYTSGIRDRAIEENIADRAETLNEAFTAFLRKEEDTKTSFDQFLKENEFARREAQLRLDRGQEDKALSIADTRVRDESLRRQALRAAGNEIATASFISQKMA